MIWVGTSGYDYPEWKGSFYPADLPAAKRLPYYAERFSTVEINYSFYRLPSEKTFGEWAQLAFNPFSFTLKAPRRITHEARLQNCEDLLNTFCTRAQSLGPKLGILLFQLPPWFRKNIPVLNAFTSLLPNGIRAAFEFRHESWYSDDIFLLLEDRGFALCITDSEDIKTPLVMTADYAYFRLRDEGYQESDIARWANSIKQHTASLKDTFVYFKHEEEGKGPEFAQLLRAHLERG